MEKDQDPSSSGKERYVRNNSRGRHLKYPRRYGQPGRYRGINEETTDGPSSIQEPFEDPCERSDRIHYPHLFTAPPNYTNSFSSSKEHIFNNSQNGPKKHFNSKKFYKKRDPNVSLNNNEQDLGACGGESLGSSHSNNHSSHRGRFRRREHHKSNQHDDQMPESFSSLSLEEKGKLDHTFLDDKPPSEHSSRKRNNPKYHHSYNNETGNFNDRRPRKSYNRYHRSSNYSNESEILQTFESLEPSAPPEEEISLGNNDEKFSNKSLSYDVRNENANSRTFYNGHQNNYKSSGRGRYNKRQQGNSKGNRNNYLTDNDASQGVDDFTRDAWPKKSQSFPQRIFEKLKPRLRYRNGEKRCYQEFSFNDDGATQRESMTQQLKTGDYECMVCCESVRQRDPIWSCSNCFNLFHLACIRKWAKSSTTESGTEWRCPACQNVCSEMPREYLCFCGKVRHPGFNPHLTPHSCGEMCGKNRGCPHRCTLQCHPGACPTCVVQVKRACACGKSDKLIQCGTSDKVICDQTCGRELSCKFHTCKEPCHTGECQPCQLTVKQFCFCGKEEREVPCTEDTCQVAHYSCGQKCNKELECKFHKCELMCHDGLCPPCHLLPSEVKTCPCGKANLESLPGAQPRKSCIDPIPTCGATCDKPLPCGGYKESHSCKEPCHEGPCPPCPLTSAVRCRCGLTTKIVPCKDVTADPPLCDRRCNRRKSCGRHRCNQICCIDLEHRCDLACNKKLSCGLHQCSAPCHLGNCPTCTNVSFDDLPCHCGKTVTLAPIPCGTKPPECKEICTREHSCDHTVTHQCHSDPECPPCTALTEKWCFGKHELRSNVPCFVESLSCGKACSKPLKCGQHTCQQLCHSGPCEQNDFICTQPCPVPRPDCGHPCALPCHTGSCRPDSCKVMVPLTCSCGHRKETVPCGASSTKQTTLSLLSAKMQDLQAGQSIDIAEVLGALKKNTKLECNEECAVIERNKRLAEALQINLEDHNKPPPPPNYSEFLKEEARRNPEFVRHVHDTIHNLVLLAKQSKAKSRSHSFPAMKASQRHVVHEIAEHFMCETQSFDLEPHRNVVVTALKHLSIIPSCSVLTIVQRESGMRKGPSPVTSLEKPTSTPAPAPCPAPKPVVDYFDFE